MSDNLVFDKGGHIGEPKQSGRRYLKCRIGYYPNATSSFQIERLITSGDICPNPGPATSANKCPVCQRTIAINHRAISCDKCDLWCHMKCGKVSAREYKQTQNTHGLNWMCPVCLANVLPFSVNGPDSDEEIHEHITSAVIVT